MGTPKKPGKAIKAGDQFWLYDDGPWHVRGFVDDRIVARSWSQRGWRWQYQCFHAEELEIYSIELAPPGCGPIGETE